MAEIPTYYVMERDKGMAATVAPFMPSTAEIAQCGWLTEAEVDVYATEYARTQFTGALQGYRVRRGSDPKALPRCTRSQAAPSTSHPCLSGEERLGGLPDCRRRREHAEDRVHSHGGLSFGGRRWSLGAAGAAGKVTELLTKFLQDQPPRDGKPLAENLRTAQ